ncbi:MAG: esterase [Prevotella sp.]|nr:esterase [Prevotella sp.]MBR0048115.1 esterase [Prevotella sp.]
MTNNPYIKQFPELFDGKKIMYVHGFGSSGQSGTVTRIRTVLPGATVVAPDLPIHPGDAIDLLLSLCQREQPDLIIGTSMGGMYAEQLYGYDRILINPAFRIADTMQEHGLTGKQQFFSPRQDGVQEFYVDKALVKEYRAVSEQNFAHAGEPDEQHRVYGLFGDNDDLVDTKGIFPYRQSISFHGEHRMNDHSFMQSVVPVIRWIDDRQEHRERPIVYIGTETLWQADGQVRPSAQKAVRMLIEHYQVFFVSFDMTGKGIMQLKERLTGHIGVPAWGHTIIADQRHLLYGDYLIQATCGARWPGKEPEPMATPIELGSDEFKTWDSVIEYFGRLGGQ